jgi:hypothetical protein
MGIFKKLIKAPLKITKKITKASLDPVGTTKKTLKRATTPIKTTKRAVRNTLDPAGIASKKNTIHSTGDIDRVSVERNPGNNARRFLRE